MLQNASRQFYNWKTFPPRGKYCKKRLKGEGWLLEKNWVGKEKWKRSEKSSKNHIRKKDEKERKKSIKSGLKTRLERFKNQKFSYLIPRAEALRASARILGPSGLVGAPPWKISRCATGGKLHVIRQWYLINYRFNFYPFLGKGTLTKGPLPPIWPPM